MEQEHRKVEFEGFKWDLRLPSNIDTEIAEWRRWEPVVTKWILSHLKDGDVALDIGANIGWFTLLMARAVGSGTVEAFEPEPSFRERLRHHLAINNIENVIAWPWAVAGNNDAVMYVAKDGAPYHSTAHVRTERKSGSDTEVSCVAIDGFWDGDRLDLIKIDVDGGEDEVLLGARETILIHRPRIAIEVAHRDTACLLESLGYEMRWERGMQVVTSENVNTIISRANPTINLLCEPK